MKKNLTLTLIICMILGAVTICIAQTKLNPKAQQGGGFPGFGGFSEEPAPWIKEGYDDHQNMMDQLGIKSLRPGKSGNDQTGPGFEEATANDWMPTLPDALVMKDGTKVTTPKQWSRRRAEILEDFEREVYGRIPVNVPEVTWEITETTRGETEGIPTIKRTLVGHVDNSGFPEITVDIQASFIVPANTPGPVPLFFQFGFSGGMFADMGGNVLQQALNHGWGQGTIVPTSIQADRGGNALRQGIIGLTNKGKPRKPEDGGLCAPGAGASAN